MGVARQYCGRLGQVANCQAGVFVACAGEGGATLVHRRLFLTELVAAGSLPARWVNCDEGYGRSTSWTGWPRWAWATWRRCRSPRGSGRSGRGWHPKPRPPSKRGPWRRNCPRRPGRGTGYRGTAAVPNMPTSPFGGWWPPATACRAPRSDLCCAASPGRTRCGSSSAMPPPGDTGPSGVPDRYAPGHQDLLPGRQAAARTGQL